MTSRHLYENEKKLFIEFSSPTYSQCRHLFPSLEVAIFMHEK